MLDWQPLLLTLKLAGITTIILFLVALPLAWWLAHSKSFTKPIIETLVSMPLVLPPTVIGFYFLLFFSPNNAFGIWLNNWLGLKLVFSFPGLVVASLLYSLPFMVHPLQSGISGLPATLTEAAYVLGKSKSETYFRIILPNMKASVLSGIVLTFAHTVGEFGVVLMIGGNIPGKTKVASIAIYDQVELLNYDAANFYSIILLLASFAILLLVYLVNGKYLKQFWK